MTYYQSEVNRLTKSLPSPVVILQVAAARKLIDQRFHENMRLDGICKEACLSKYHFARLFRRLYGCTPHQYLTEKRMQHASCLLQQGESVTHTATLTGFESSTSFAAAFRAYFSTAPSSKKSKIQ